MPATKIFETLEEAQNFNDELRRKNKERMQLGARRGGGWEGGGGREGGTCEEGRKGERRRGREGWIQGSAQGATSKAAALCQRQLSRRVGTDSHVRRLPELTRQQDRRPRAAVEASAQAGVGLDEGGPQAPVLARVGRNCRGGAGGLMDRRRRRLTPKSMMPS